MGLERLAHGERGGPVVRHAHVVAQEPQGLGQHGGRIVVVVDDQHAAAGYGRQAEPRSALAPGAGAAAAHPPAAGAR